MPSHEGGGVGGNVQAPAVQAAVPFWGLAPEIAIDTVGFTPAAVVQGPPRAVAVVLVMNGKVRAVPLTVVSAATVAAVLMVIDCAPLVALLVAVSVWVAVTL